MQTPKTKSVFIFMVIINLLLKSDKDIHVNNGK